MAAITWHESLEMASSEHEVVAVVREFIAGISPYEMEQIPQKLRPGKFFVAADITAYAFEIVRYDCEEDAARELVHRLAAFLSQASTRLSHLMAAGERPHAANEPLRSSNANR